MEATKNDWNLEPWTLDPGPWTLEPGTTSSTWYSFKCIKSPSFKIIECQKHSIDHTRKLVWLVELPAFQL